MTRRPLPPGWWIMPGLIIGPVIWAAIVYLIWEIVK